MSIGGSVTWIGIVLSVPSGFETGSAMALVAKASEERAMMVLMGCLMVLDAWGWLCCIELKNLGGLGLGLGLSLWLLYLRRSHGPKLLGDCGTDI